MQPQAAAPSAGAARPDYILNSMRRFNFASTGLPSLSAGWNVHCCMARIAGRS